LEVYLNGPEDNIKNAVIAGNEYFQEIFLDDQRNKADMQTVHNANIFSRYPEMNKLIPVKPEKVP
jgi:hypothetical protein